MTGTQDATDEDRSLAEAIGRRHTLRAAFEPRAVPSELVDRLQDEARFHESWVKPITRSEEEVATVFLISRAEEMEQGDPAYREELESWLRTDPGAEDGVPVEAVPAGDPRARPSNWLIRDFVVGQREQRDFLEPGDPDAPPPEVERPTVVLLGTDGRRPLLLVAGRPGPRAAPAHRHRGRRRGVPAHPGARLAGDADAAAVPAVVGRAPADAAAPGVPARDRRRGGQRPASGRRRAAIRARLSPSARVAAAAAGPGVLELVLVVGGPGRGRAPGCGLQRGVPLLVAGRLLGARPLAFLAALGRSTAAAPAVRPGGPSATVRHRPGPGRAAGVGSDPLGAALAQVLVTPVRKKAVAAVATSPSSASVVPSASDRGRTA